MASDDLFQEAFLHLRGKEARWRHLPEVDLDRYFRKCLERIDGVMRRREGAQKRSPGLFQPYDVDNSPSRVSAVDPTNADDLLALARYVLSPDHASLVEDRICNSLSWKEIAAIRRTPPEQLQQAFAKAKQRLRDAIDPDNRALARPEVYILILDRWGRIIAASGLTSAHHAIYRNPRKVHLLYLHRFFPAAPAEQLAAAMKELGGGNAPHVTDLQLIDNATEVLQANVHLLRARSAQDEEFLARYHKTTHLRCNDQKQAIHRVREGLKDDSSRLLVEFRLIFPARAKAFYRISR